MKEEIIKVLKEFEQIDYKRGGVSIAPEMYDAIAEKLYEKMKYEEIVSELNSKLYELHEETELTFNYLTDGYYHAILFDDILIWSSELDDREWIEEKNDYEPFEPYIIKEFNKWADKIYSLKLEK